MTSAFSAAVSFVTVACFCPLLIRGLLALGLTQPIRTELPADHQAKRGTPLMAGIILLPGIIPLLIFHSPNIMTVFLCSVFFLFSVIGFVDDFTKAARQNPSGISGKTKLLLQFTVAGFLLYFLSQAYTMNTNLVFLDFQITIPPSLYILLVLLFIVGSANAINFTDGLDGLLIVVAVPTYFFFFAVSDKIEVQLFSLTMIAGLMGLLIYNMYPARAFMGDTGSLAIGGSLAFLAVIEKAELLIPILFFVYFAEQLSVIFQVWYYKRTKLRLFKMAPVHYHFSLKYGWSENKTVTVFGLISWLCSLVSLLLRKYMHV